MKYRVLIFFAILWCSFSVSGQEYPENENDTIIVWTPNRKLNWSDFQQQVNKNTGGAQSDIGLSIISIHENNRFSYVVFPYFYKQRSSTSTNEAYVLKHEQLHFDIAELYARKMRLKLEELSTANFDRSRYNNAVDKVYSAYLSEQEKYDKETGHSLKVKNQHRWAERIAKDLVRLEQYKSKRYID